MRFNTAVIAVLFLSLSSYLFAQNKSSITGRVLDAATLKPVPGANVIIIGETLGAAANENGEFEIAGVPPGAYVLKASSIGYDPVVLTDVVVASARPKEIEFKLNETVIEISGVTVSSGYFEKDPADAVSISKFGYEEIRRSPGGYEDVVRALSVLPGVAQAAPGRNDLVVRGGAPSENLYLVDGFVSQNINHFGTQGATGGPTSYVNLDFVKETAFSTGGFSSAYGDKLSSVLRIDLREGRTDKIGGKATISASQFGLNIEGPISDNMNFLFSARRSYLDFIFKAAGFGFVPEYYDMLGKITYKINETNSISFLYLGAFDYVKFFNDTEDQRYDNSRTMGSDQLQYLTGLSYKGLLKHGYYNISLSRNFVDYDTRQRDSLLNPVFTNVSREGENALKADLVYKLGHNTELNVGAIGRYTRFKADVKLPSFITSFGDTLLISSLVSEEKYYKAGMYAQVTQSMFHRFRITIGGRMDYFSAIENDMAIAPRFSASYALDDLSNINFSTGIYYQAPAYIWMQAYPENTKLDFIRADQFILGYERHLREDMNLRLEGFYKKYSNYPTSKLRQYLVLANTGAGYSGSDDNFSSFGLEPLSSDGKGRAYGAELSIQKKAANSPLYALLSLTYSESYYTPLDGIERIGSYDQTWLINFTSGYIFNEKWEASMKFRFATGKPYTPYNYGGTQDVSKFNTERLDPQHSVDLRVDRRWNFTKWSLIAYLDVQNIYNNRTAGTIRWDYRENKTDESSSIGILPSIGISAEF
ncbi:MAG TPA: TonB-dependent receptor [Ignavibacteriales bacterium]|nr:TonB-dependent receptor [Ignavibacteriales bacterium]